MLENTKKHSHLKWQLNAIHQCLKISYYHMHWWIKLPPTITMSSPNSWALWQAAPAARGTPPTTPALPFLSQSAIRQSPRIGGLTSPDTSPQTYSTNPSLMTTPLGYQVPVPPQPPNPGTKPPGPLQTWKGSMQRLHPSLCTRKEEECHYELVCIICFGQAASQEQ